MRWIITITLSLITFNSFAPPVPLYMVYDPYVEQIYKDHCTINNNLEKLYDDDIRTRPEVFQLIQPILEIYLREYTDNYVIGDSLSWALACIFVSESSNGKGHSGRSTLWLEHNNPFGMTTGKIGKNVTKMSWEMINGNRVNMYRTFKTYNSLKEATESLLWDYLLKERYEPVKQAITVKEFLHILINCGYATNLGWSNWAYNEIYLKSI